MKFQPDTPEGVNLITRQEPGRIWVGSMPFSHSVLVPWHGAVLPWRADENDASTLCAQPEQLTAAHFQRTVAMGPELVIFGSGARLRFVQPALLRALMAARIGIETMDTPAACRTYNVLVSEGRRVLAALVVASPVASPVTSPVAGTVAGTVTGQTAPPA